MRETRVQQEIVAGRAPGGVTVWSVYLHLTLLLCLAWLYASAETREARAAIESGSGAGGPRPRSFRSTAHATFYRDLDFMIFCDSPPPPWDPPSHPIRNSYPLPRTTVYTSSWTLVLAACVHALAVARPSMHVQTSKLAGQPFCRRRLSVRATSVPRSASYTLAFSAGSLEWL